MEYPRSHRNSVQPWDLGRIASMLIQRRAAVRYDPDQRRLLFESRGDAIDLADLMAGVRRDCARVSQATDIAIAPNVLAQHHERFFAKDPLARYVLNRGDAERDQAASGDAISLRQYRSFLFFPANLLFRMDVARPEDALAFAESVRIAAEKLLATPAAQRDEGVRKNAMALLDYATDIQSNADPRLARLIEEQLLHNIMAHRALFRQPPCRGGDIFIRITDLPEEALARYVASLHAPEDTTAALVFERAFMSTALSARGATLYSRRYKRFKLIVRSLGAGSRGRHLDGSVEGIWSGEEEVVFPPGTAFRVTRLEEGIADDRTEQGEPRTYIFLQEVSAAAASALERGVSSRGTPAQLYIYGTCNELPDVMRKAAADVVCTLTSQRIPCVLLSRRAGWDALAVTLANPQVSDLPTGQAELARWGSGLFRIAVDPCERFLPWAELVATFEISPGQARELQVTAKRAHGDLDDCWLSLEPVERRHWRSLEVWSEDSDEWIEVELPPVLPNVVGARQRKQVGCGPVQVSLDLDGLSQEVQGILETAYKRPFQEAYIHPRTGEVVAVRYSPSVEPFRGEVPRWTHGAMHAARTTLWGLLLSELYRYYTGGTEPHLRDLLLAMTHHDCAREDEGADYWDRQSGDRCAAYLEARGDVDAAHRAYFADAIANKERRNTLARQMIQAADCLDILRVPVFMKPLQIQRGWEPRGAFNSDRLDLYRVIADAEGKHSADALLHEIHHFIRLTEVPETRVWCESRVNALLLELVGAVAYVHRRHACYPLLDRWLAPFLRVLPPGYPTATVAELLDAYFESITHPDAVPVQVKSDAPWAAMWDRARWRTQRTMILGDDVLRGEGLVEAGT
jgi:hypothetical protein